VCAVYIYYFNSPAHGGASKGQILTLQILHENNCNLWKENVRKDQPIHYAVHSGNKEIPMEKNTFFWEKSFEQGERIWFYGYSPSNLRLLMPQMSLGNNLSIKQLRPITLKCAKLMITQSKICLFFIKFLNSQQILVEHKAELNPIMKTSNGHFFTPLDLSKQHNLRTCEKYLRSSGCLSARQMLNNNDLSE